MKLHLRHHGRSQTLEAERIGIDRWTDDPSIEEALRRAGLLDPASKDPLVIDRHPDSLVVRPPAVFG